MRGALNLLRERAARRGKDPDAYLLELLSADMDPAERFEAYINASEYFWREGLRLLEVDVRQASEKLWNSVVQLVKAYAERRGLPHDSHRLIWRAVRELAREDDEIITLFAAVEQLHVNFYEGHLEREDVEKLAKDAERLREKIKKRL